MIDFLILKDIEFTPLEDFEFWLEEMEEKAAALSVKASGKGASATRADAVQLRSSVKVIKQFFFKKIFQINVIKMDNIIF